jgi:hypothetical protein
MRLIQTLLWGLIITLSNLPVLAWQVTLQSTDTPAQVMVSNDTQLHGVNVYLVWFNIDSANSQFVSLTFEQNSAEWRWQSGLKPVFNTPIDLPAFDSYNIAFENQSCPETHRCFLGFYQIPV